MKKLFLTATLILSLLSPVAVFAQTPSTAYCQQLYGSSFTYNGTTCVNSTGGTEPATAPSSQSNLNCSGGNSDNCIQSGSAAATPSSNSGTSNSQASLNCDGTNSANCIQSGSAAATPSTVPNTAPSTAGSPTGTTPPATATTPSTLTSCGSNCNLGYVPLEPIPALPT